MMKNGAVPPRSDEFEAYEHLDRALTALIAHKAEIEAELGHQDELRTKLGAVCSHIEVITRLIARMREMPAQEVTVAHPGII